jgi:hypothetical protein
MSSLRRGRDRGHGGGPWPPQVHPCDPRPRLVLSPRWAKAVKTHSFLKENWVERQRTFPMATVFPIVESQR